MPDNDNNGGENPLANGSQGNEAAKQAGLAVLQKLNKDGSVRKPPGRKPGVDYSKKDTTGSQGQTPKGIVTPPTPLVDRETVKRSVQGVLKTVDAMICRRVYSLSMRLTASATLPKGDKGFAEGLVQDTQITPEELEISGDLTATVAEKYALLGQYAPEIFLAICLGTYGFRQWNTLAKLQDLLAAKSAEVRKQNESRASAPQDTSDRG